MQFSGVTHGTWCNARTHRVKCKTCKTQVFFFSCDCGCKIYFASLGGKWPEHICISAGVSTDVQHLPRGSTAELMRHHEESLCKKEEALREQQYAESRRKRYEYEQQVAQMEAQQKERREAQMEAYTRDREVIRQERRDRRKAKRQAIQRVNATHIAEVEKINVCMEADALALGQEFTPIVPQLVPSERAQQRQRSKSGKIPAWLVMYREIRNGVKYDENTYTPEVYDKSGNFVSGGDLIGVKGMYRIKPNPEKAEEYLVRKQRQQAISAVDAAQREL